MRIPGAGKFSGTAAAFITSSYLHQLSLPSLFVASGLSQHFRSTVLAADSPTSSFRKTFCTNNSDIMGGGNSEHSCSDSSSKLIRLDRSSKIMLHHIESVGSTQDEARAFIKDNTLKGDVGTESFCFAISASEQLKGRGTQGRQWIGARGNTFVTIGVPMKSIPITISLLPLKVGSIIANQISNMLKSLCQKQGNTNLQQGLKYAETVSVKWPNDVLIHGDKVAGVLIESEMDKDNNIWLLVGIGINVAYAPVIDSTGPHRGRKSTCLKNHCDCESFFAVEDNQENAGELLEEVYYVQQANELASLLAIDLAKWIVSLDHKKSMNEYRKGVIDEWTKWTEFGQELVLRDKPGNEKVITVGIKDDGQLIVKDQDGKEQLLVADYLL